MKLPEIDLLDAELPETAPGLRNQICGASVRGPLIRPRTRQARLCGDQQSFIGMKRLADQLLRDIGAVAVGRVDEIDADLGEPAQRGKRCMTVGRRSPDAAASNSHGAITETIDRDVSDPELAGGAGVDRVHCTYCSRSEGGRLGVGGQERRRVSREGLRILKQRAV